MQSHSFICEHATVAVMGLQAWDEIPLKRQARAGYCQPERITQVDKILTGSVTAVLTVTICSDVDIGADSGVIHEIVQRGIYVDNPARLFRLLVWQMIQIVS